MKAQVQEAKIGSHVTCAHTGRIWPLPTFPSNSLRKEKFPPGASIRVPSG